MITLIVALGEVPLGARVRKITGEVFYTVTDKISIYNEDTSQKIIKAERGTAFMISDNGYINAVSVDKKVALDMQLVEAIEFLQELEDESHSHN